MKQILLLLTVFLITEPQCISQIIRVPDDKTTIQAAIYIASDGDTVLVGEGTYLENIDFHGKPITVASLFILDSDTSHISRTIIDGSQPLDPDRTSVVSMRSGEDTTSVLTGFTITGGTGTYDLEDDVGYGGGIFIYGSGGKITYNIIENNHMGDELGPWALPYSGGGIYAVVFNNHSLIIRENIIRNNSCTGVGGSGGGAQLTGGRIIFENNSVLNNRMDSDGDPIGVGLSWMGFDYGGSIDECIIRNNIISGNEGYSIIRYGIGGGVSLTFALSKKTEVYNNIISENYIEGIGGGMFFNNAGACISNNIVINNQATENGNSLSVYIEGWGNELVLFNNIIWSIIENGRSDVHFWGALDTHSNFYYNLLMDSLSIEDSVMAFGNYYKEPKFKIDSYEPGEFSPAIGRGVDSVLIDGNWYFAAPTDFLGNERPDPIDPYVDLGAIESGYLFTGLKDIKIPGLLVFPNPTNSLITIHTESYERYNIQITSMSGQLILNEKLEGNTQQIDLSSFHEGVYYITIRSKGFVSTRKIIKLK